MTFAGKLKAKRLQNMVDSIRDQALGPYSEGRFNASTGATTSLNPVSFDNLSEGQGQANAGKVIIGKVIFSLQPPEGVPL